MDFYDTWNEADFARSDLPQRDDDGDVYDYEIGEKKKKKKKGSRRSERRRRKKMREMRKKQIAALYNDDSEIHAKDPASSSISKRAKEILQSQEKERSSKVSELFDNDDDDDDDDDDEDIEAMVLRASLASHSPLKSAVGEPQTLENDDDASALDFSKSDLNVMSGKLDKALRESKSSAATRGIAGLGDTGGSVVQYGSVDLSNLSSENKDNDSGDDYEDDDFFDDDDDDDIGIANVENVKAAASAAATDASDAASKSADLALKDARDLADIHDESMEMVDQATFEAAPSKSAGEVDIDDDDDDNDTDEHKCLRNSECRCPKCAVSIAGESNLKWNAINRLRDLTDAISRRYRDTKKFSISDAERLRSAHRTAVEAGMSAENECSANAHALLDSILREIDDPSLDEETRQSTEHAVDDDDDNSTMEAVKDGTVEVTPDPESVAAATTTVICSRTSDCRCENCIKGLASLHAVASKCVPTEEAVSVALAVASEASAEANGKADLALKDVRDLLKIRDASVCKSTDVSSSIEFASSRSSSSKKGEKDEASSLPSETGPSRKDDALSESQRFRVAAAEALQYDDITDSEAEEEEKRKFWSFVNNGAKHPNDAEGTIDGSTDEQMRALKNALAEKDDAMRSMREMMHEQRASIEQLRRRCEDSEQSLALQKKRNEHDALAEATAMQMTKNMKAVLESVSANDTSVASASKVSGDEAREKLENELRMQETLIVGYQKENERLLRQLKDVESQSRRTKAQLVHEHQKLGHVMNSLHRCGDEDNGENSEGSSRETKVAQAARLRRELELESQVTALKDKLAEMSTRSLEAQRDLRDRLEKMRSEKRRIEIEYAGVNVEEIQRDALELKRIRSQLQQERQEHSIEVDRLEAKIRWHVQNADVVDRHAALVASQANEIATLRKDLEQRQSGPAGTRMEGKLRGRVKALERQLRDAENVIRRRNPDSIANLLRTVGPSPEEEAEIRSLREKVEHQTRELQEKDEVFDTKLRALQQQHERVIADLQKELAAEKQRRRRRDDAGKTPTKSSSSTDREVERVSQFWRRKLQQLEARHRAQEAARARGGGEKTATLSTKHAQRKESSSSSSTAPRPNAKNRVPEGLVRVMIAALEKFGPNQFGHRLRSLRNVIEGADREGCGRMSVEHIRSALLQAPGSARKFCDTVRWNRARVATSTVVAYDYLFATLIEKRTSRSQVDESDDREYAAAAAAAAVGKIRSSVLPPPVPSEGEFESKKSDNVPPAKRGERPLAALEDLKRRNAELERANKDLMRELSRDDGRLLATEGERADRIRGELSSQRVAHASMVRELTEKHAQELVRITEEQRVRWVGVVSAAQEKVASLAKKVVSLQSKVDTPETVGFQNIEERIREIEASHRLRESQLRELLRKTRVQGSSDLEDLQERHAEEIAKKNAEIRRFRHELDAMLAVLQTIQGT